MARKPKRSGGRSRSGTPSRGAREYLALLKDAAEAVANSASVAEALGAMVALLAKRLRLDVCSIYLDDGAGHLVLRASQGLNPESLGRVRMSPEEGLSGLVFSTETSLFLSKAAQHPRFKYFPETGEERFSSFGGVPLVRRGRCVGVLTAQTTREFTFRANDVVTLEAAAQQVVSLLGVSGALPDGSSPALAEADGDGGASHAGPDGGAPVVGEPPRGRQAPKLAQRARRLLAGVGTSPGSGLGRAVLLGADPLHTPPPSRPFGGVERELARFTAARDEAGKRLEALAARLDQQGHQQMGHQPGAAAGAIFRVHQELLWDGAIEAGVRARIEERREPAERAVFETFEALSLQLAALPHAHVREKVYDLLDARAELLEALSDGGEDLSSSAEVRRLREVEDAVIVADVLTPAQTARLDPSRVVAVVTAHGSEASHASILARSLGIPAVVAVPDLVGAIAAGDPLLVDGDSGFVFVEPEPSLAAEYTRRVEAARAVGERVLRELEARRAEGPQVSGVSVLANAGFPIELRAAREFGADGIGLLRTEFYFLSQSAWPTLDEQVAVYRRALRSAPAGPVVVRLLDAGGDKALPYMEPSDEPNPILGLRSVRLLLAHPEVARTQIEALLRAADEERADLRMLVPLVTAAWELTAVRDMLDDATRRHDVAPRPLGMMVEAPSVLYLIEDLAPLADFVSIGTNDLTQYLLAVDRDNELVRHYYSPYHPAVVRALADLQDRLIALGKPGSVCGEQAGEPLGALALLALGFRSLSVRPRAVPALRCLLHCVDERSLPALRSELLAAGTPGEVERTLRQALRQAAPFLLEV